jgi:branched-chain amino acid transport system ATP-binding protein
MPAILETRHLTKRFGELSAVKELDLEVEEGEILGIAGPNGAGKTTLFNLISGFMSGTGAIIFRGESIHGLRPHQVCQRGLVRSFQTTTIFASLTVNDNVRVGAHFGDHLRDEKRIIAETLELVGLMAKRDVQARHLSLFDKKKTMLAAALATRPQLLMLDEPIGGLSPLEIQQSIDLVRQINQEMKITLIIIEHLMKVLMSISSRMMILHNGEKICMGSPEEVAGDKRVLEVYLGADYA